MLANTRIQWLHKKITELTYPNANRLSERFGISHRQAQRDVDMLRKQLHAPLAYDVNRKGFYYTAPYTLPLLLAASNDSTLLDEDGELTDTVSFNEDGAAIQMQLPYTATVEIPDKLAVLELSSFIISREGHHRYTCEFHSVERFLSVLIAAASGARILAPDWLRERLLKTANDIIAANSSPEE